MHLKIYVTENIFLCTLFHQSLCISFNRLELTQEITFPINVDCIKIVIFYTEILTRTGVKRVKNPQFNFSSQNISME